MGIFQSVSNWLEGSYKVRTTKLTDAAQLQHIRIDAGSGTTESVVTSANPFPVAVISGGSAAVPTNSRSTAQEASRIVKASPGTLYGVSGFNNASTDQFIQLFNSTTLPANGVVPAVVIRAYAGEPFSYFAEGGEEFTTGIVICNSTTGPTKTLGSNNCLFFVRYI